MPGPAAGLLAHGLSIPPFMCGQDRLVYNPQPLNLCVRRTSRTNWYSGFKPFTDCTAQYPANPSSDTLKALGFPAASPGAAVHVH